MVVIEADLFLFLAISLSNLTKYQFYDHAFVKLCLRLCNEKHSLILQSYSNYTLMTITVTILEKWFLLGR